MSDPAEDANFFWRRMEDDWARAREGWRDGTTEKFAGQFWQPLESEMGDYLRAVEQLMQVLRAAQEVTRQV